MTDEVAHATAPRGDSRKRGCDVLTLMIRENDVGEGVSRSIQVMH
jgi:hypothetical protein